MLLGQPYDPAPEPFTLTFGEGAARLSRHSGLLLRGRHGYRFVEPGHGAGWQVATTGYAYRLLDRQGRHILSYHWHPDGRSPVISPHPHVACQIPPYDLRRTHLPTGIVVLPMAIRMAITELGVEPMRAEWEAVLIDAEQGLVG